MPFESLSYRHVIPLPDLPPRWLSLTYLYDADLPLFPICYFHTHPDALPAGQRPAQADRAFGYVESLNSSAQGEISATVVLNKNLTHGAQMQPTKVAVEDAVRHRLGLADAVTQADVTDVFDPPNDAANAVLPEIWARVVLDAYGNKLPFGRLWDEVMGLARYVASFHSQSGRKGELIQTHYFASKFGERIQAGAGIPQVDFFLLPSWRELSDPANPLTYFPAFKRLLDAALAFQQAYCSLHTVEGIDLSRFNNPGGRRLTGDKFNDLARQLGHAHIAPLVECFNAFGKGAPRTVVFLMLLADLRAGRLLPSALTPAQCGAMYDRLGNSYQSPKVVQILAQQCFGNRAAMPIDTWVETFLQWPLMVMPVQRAPGMYRQLFVGARNLGKVERLIWVAAQSRKVHSSACNDALWCLKKGSGDTLARGANPLACNVCYEPIRSLCPAYGAIRQSLVCFNRPRQAGEQFEVSTTSGDNATPNQGFIVCRGSSIYGEIVDEFSPQDMPNGFGMFPAPGHAGVPITVERFEQVY